eukprot:1967171-Prymnesium_polylepis.1
MSIRLGMVTSASLDLVTRLSSAPPSASRRGCAQHAADGGWDCLLVRLWRGGPARPRRRGRPSHSARIVEALHSVKVSSIATGPQAATSLAVATGGAAYGWGYGGDMAGMQPS